MARRKRAHNEDGSFKADDQSTPDVNEAFVDEAPAELELTPEQINEMQKKLIEEREKIIDKIVHNEAPASEEAPAAEEPAVEPEAPVAVETPAAAAPADTTALQELLAEKRKDPEVTEQPKDEGLKPMTEERLQEIRQNAITPASVEKAEIDKIIDQAGVAKTRGREIAARLIFNARKNGGFV